MFRFEQELESLGSIATDGVRIWVRANCKHPVVGGFLRRGRGFAKMPFKAARDAGVESIRQNDQLVFSIKSLMRLLCTSYDAKVDLLSAEYLDVFASADVHKALRSIFCRRGWSSYVWQEPFVEYSSFRAAIGLTLLIYGLYINDSLKNGNVALALTQCQDANNLLLLDWEKKISVSKRKLRNELADRNRRAANEKLKKDPKQKAKAMVKECWDDWQVRILRGENPYRGKAAFARAMLDKFEDLESQAVIVRWCSEWSKVQEKTESCVAE